MLSNAADLEFPFPSPVAAVTFSELRADTVDDLVAAAVDHVLGVGERVSTRAGTAVQAYGVNYVLNCPRQRVHALRPGALRYLCRELLAYFSGSLKAQDGLSNASTFWSSLVDQNGNINSNYGHYVFHQNISVYGSQYAWVIQRLVDNRDTRRAVININQPWHKSETLDFPCTISIQFYIRSNTLICEVNSRSTDVVTGLPYDMGFFSFLHELVFCDLRERGVQELMLGATIMKTSFTQIYDRTLAKAFQARSEANIPLRMPAIDSAKAVLNDIYGGTRSTPVLKWIAHHAA